MSKEQFDAYKYIETMICWSATIFAVAGSITQLHDAYYSGRNYSVGIGIFLLVIVGIGVFVIKVVRRKKVKHLNF